MHRLEGHDSVGYLPLLGGLQGEGLRSDASNVFVPFFLSDGDGLDSDGYEDERAVCCYVARTLKAVSKGRGRKVEANNQ